MNNDLNYQGSDLMLDRLPLADVAKEFGTPVYVYSAWEQSDRYATRSRPTRTLRSFPSSSAWASAPTR
jgi:hypothetical protein